MTIRSFSYGGGIQSTACLVLAAEQQIGFPLFVFANVGDDSEHPATLAYVRDVAEPYARQHGIEFVTVAKKQTVYENLVAENRNIAIPVYLSNGAPGNRNCTIDWKIRVIASYLKKRGASKTDPALVGLGISLDEVHRARTDSGIAHEVLAYPLLDLRLSRANCVGIIERAGLPVPGKSACWFCPYQRTKRWRELQRTYPDLWEKAIDLERRINVKRGVIGRDVVYLHPSLKPLDEAVPLDEWEQSELFDACESGYCWT